MADLIVLKPTEVLVLPPTLKAAITASMPASYSAPGDDAPFVVTAPYVPNQAAIDAARATLGASEASLHPLDRAAFRRWLLSLATAVANGPASREDFDAKFAGLLVAVFDMPALCFTDATLSQAIRSFKFFPSGAELFAFAEAIARPIRLEVQAIRKIAAFRHPGDPSAPSEPTDAEREEVAGKVRSLKAEFAGREQNARRDEKLRPKALPLSEQALLAEYERYVANADNPSNLRAAASVRVSMLRQKMGAVPVQHAAE